MIRVSGSRNKPGCSAGDEIPKTSGDFGIESEQKVQSGNIRTLYCSFRFFSSPGLGSEPGGQSHSSLEAEGRLKGVVGGGAPHKAFLCASRCRAMT